MTPVANILNRAADRLSKEGAWAQRALAKTLDGTHVAPNNSDACSWCAIGAIRAETKDVYLHHRVEIALGKAIGTPYLTIWNDDPERTQDEVVATFRKAAQRELIA